MKPELMAKARRVKDKSQAFHTDCQQIRENGRVVHRKASHNPALAGKMLPSFFSAVIDGTRRVEHEGRHRNVELVLKEGDIGVWSIDQNHRGLVQPKEELFTPQTVWIDS